MVEQIKHIDGSDHQFRRLIKAHNRAKYGKHKKDYDHFETKRYKGELFRKGSVRADDIKQSQIGNCYLLAALKSIAQRNPELIEDMIAQRPDGTVVVRLWDRKEEDGNISFTPVEYHLDNTVIYHAEKMNTHHAAWVYLVEKAYMLHRLRHNEDTANRPWTAAEILRSGHSTESYEYLLGINTNLSRLEAPREHLLDKIQLEPSAYELYQVHEPARLSLMNNLYLTDTDIKETWQLLIKNKALANKLLDAFPINHYGDLHALIDSIKTSTESNLITHPETIQRLWPALTETETYQVLISLQNANEIYKTSQANHKEKTRHNLVNLLQQGELICAGSATDEASNLGIISNHAYHLVNMYQRGDTWYVMLENPWGQGVPTERFQTGNINNAAVEFKDGEFEALKDKNGTFEITFDNFVKTYRSSYNTNINKTSDLLRKRAEKTNKNLQLELEKQKKFLKRQILVDNPSLISHVDIDKQIEIINHQLEQLKTVVNDLEQHTTRDDDEDAFLAFLIKRQAALENQLDKISITGQADDTHDDTVDSVVPVADTLRTLTAAQDNAVTAAHDKSYHALQAKSTLFNIQKIVSRSDNPEGYQNKSGHNALLSVKAALQNYLASAEENNHRYQKKSAVGELRYRLFYRGADRLISKERKRRANTAIAMIDTWHRASNPDDRDTIYGMLQILQQHHDNQTSLGNRFHGNRLGKILKGIRPTSTQKAAFQPLSHEAERLLRNALRDRGLNPNMQENTFLLDLKLKPETLDTPTDVLSQHLGHAPNA